MTFFARDDMKNGFAVTSARLKAVPSRQTYLHLHQGDCLPFSHNCAVW
jgi:hypothetical protein